MSTKETILALADNLIKDKGFNAFSFHDLSKSIGIKTASIHYHFPSKTDLGVAIVKMHIQRFEKLKEEMKDKNALQKLEAFFSIYSKLKSENQVCLVGSLATDLHTVDKEIKNELKTFSELILNWIIEILEEGKSAKLFYFKIPVRTKALMIITNMLAIVQLARLTKQDDFKVIKNTILNELKK